MTCIMGSVCPDPLCQSKAIHRSWHTNVCQHKVYNHVYVLDDGYGFIAAGCLKNLEATLLKIVRKHCADQELILHHQNGRSPIRYVG